VSQASVSEVLSPSPPPSTRPGLGRKISAAIMKGQFEPTVVHRTQFKSRPSLISIDKVLIEITPEGSPSTSAGESSSGKSSAPRPGESTGKTSLDSKFSTKSKGISQHSSENKKIIARQMTGEGGSNENQLTTIAEVEICEEPEPVPSQYFGWGTMKSANSCLAIVTVEKAAAAKVFFECYYNIATSGDLTPRSIRRRQLEGALYQDSNLTTAEKDEHRRILARRESDHLRETRAMKNRGSKALKGTAAPSSKYEVVKVLGKGSFGVVRLVREKADNK
jgi:protein-serine/threonine kinase